MAPKGPSAAAVLFPRAYHAPAEASPRCCRQLRDEMTRLSSSLSATLPLTCCPTSPQAKLSWMPALAALRKRKTDESHACSSVWTRSLVVGLV
ncbi:uncharacterized protein K452DRAFT_31485 [Aplosporella prunicola CBS 121167]|uniref:Uncharacterized protein n=1 Tax=Aplosporella prunicola CBS 121167 TaxID=1176127 RepID=A0A6A6BE50_9PEZI|nr:uncharacterized protein K452DRAFT_31485 [Aplosporella prunicola CBS 121167]KAF2141653.1 hypothetical protein K452DRAFT_31485 [Aplosporella prunicola CBS 121167]